MSIPKLYTSHQMRRIGGGNVEGNELTKKTLWVHMQNGICPKPAFEKHKRYWWTEQQAEEYFKNRFGEINQ